MQLKLAEVGSFHLSPLFSSYCCIIPSFDVFVDREARKACPFPTLFPPYTSYLTTVKVLQSNQLGLKQ